MPRVNSLPRVFPLLDVYLDYLHHPQIHAKGHKYLEELDPENIMGGGDDKGESRICLVFLC
jgi:hypothetical protein